CALLLAGLRLVRSDTPLRAAPRPRPRPPRPPAPSVHRSAVRKFLSGFPPTQFVDIVSQALRGHTLRMRRCSVSALLPSLAVFRHSFPPSTAHLFRGTTADASPDRKSVV